MKPNLPRSLPPEAFLDHAVFVSGLARALVTGDEDVGDVVQENWLAAPDKRHAEGARKVEVRTPEGLAARRKILQGISTAWATLPVPYHDALVLRFHEELPPREVARRLAVPVETARTRIRGGLVRLRELLDEGHEGNRAAWAEPLARLLSPGRATFGGRTVVIGGLVVAALLVVGLVFLALPQSKKARPPVEQAQHLPDENEVEAPTLVGRAGASEDAQSVVPPTPALPFASGRVVDPEGHPLANVTVLVRRRVPAACQPTVLVDDAVDPHDVGLLLSTTDPRGSFVVAKRPADLASLAFFKPGWAITEVRGLAERPEGNQDLRVVLERGREIRGVVRNTAGEPVAKAWVHARRNEPPHLPMRTTSDESGVYRLSGLPHDPVSILCAAFGYVPVPLRGKVAGPEVVEMDLTIRRAYMVVDVLDAESGSGIPNAHGLVLDTDDGRLHEIMADQSTRMPAQVLVPGRLKTYFPFHGSAGRRTLSGDVYVFAPGYVPQRRRVEMARTDEPPHLVFSLSRGEGKVAIRGRVRDGDGAITGAIAEVRVTNPRRGELWLANTETLARQPVEPDGTFAFKGLPAGPYWLLVEAQNRAPVALKVMAPTKDLDIELQFPAALEVEAVSGTGGAVPDAWITLDLRDPSRRWHAQTGRDGKVRLEGLPPGDGAILGARADGGGPVWLGDRSTPVRLLPGETTKIELRVPLPVATVILVQDSEGSPACGVPLHLRWRRPFAALYEEIKRVEALRPMTDDAGKVVLDLLPGGYECVVEFGVSGRLAKRFEVGLDPGRPVELVIPKGSGRIQGYVRERGTGRPIPGRPVYLKDIVRETLVGRTVTDDAGAYAFEDLHPGRFDVSFVLDATPDGTYDATSPYPSARTEIHLTPGERRDLDVDVPRVLGEGAPPRAFELEVVVRSRTAATPLPDARGHVTAQMDQIWIDVGTFTTDAEGRATVLVLEASRYEVLVSWRPDSDKRKVVHGRTEYVPVGRRGLVEVDLSERPEDE